MIAFIEFWATVLSPIVGVVAIIVALIVSRQSAKDAGRQIAAVHGLLDVVVAAQSPAMADAKHHYERQIAQLNGQIREAEFDLQTEHYPFFGRGPRIDDIEAIEEMVARKRHLEDLLQTKKEMESRLAAIDRYFDRAESV